MGRVYLAEHVKMERRCAIKVMSPELVSDADAISRFNREATNASRIQHPNVATVYDFGESADGLVFLAMEFVPGEALSRICDREHALPAARAANIARQVADGLDAAHDLGIIHRDLKPDNIMIARAKDGRDIVKIVDFGIAKGTQQGAAGREALTRTGVVVGTLQYMSPEQLGGDPVDGRSDLYALGCMLYEMLTGESSFAGATIEARLQRRLTGEPLHPRAANPSVPAWLDALVAKSLAREPGARFQTAADLRDALAVGAGGAPSPSAPPFTLSRARRLWFSAGALAGAATLVVLGMTWHRNETEQADARHPQVSVPSAPDSAPARVPAAVAPAAPDSGPPPTPPRREPAPTHSSADLTPTSQLDLMQIQRAALAARQTAIDSGAAESSVRRGDRLMQAADSAIARRRFDLAMRAMLDARSTWRAASDSAAAVRLTEHPAVPSAGAAGPPPTPPASPPPAGSPAHTSAAAPVDPTPGIQAAIATYARALASRDIAQLRAAYPALTADEARRWQDIFDATNSITASLSLAGPPHVSSSGSADVDVTATFDFDYKRGADGERHPTVTYHAVLVRDGQQWKIASIK